MRIGKFHLYFHRKSGITPGWRIGKSNYGIGTVLWIRLHWSLLTLAWLRS